MGVTHAHLGPIWYHSKLSDVPYSPNQFLALDLFCFFVQQDCSSLVLAQLSCSLDPTINSKTMDPNFYEYFDQRASKTIRSVKMFMKI